MKNREQKAVSCKVLSPKRKKQIAIKNEHSLKYMRKVSPEGLLKNKDIV